MVTGIPDMIPRNAVDARDVATSAFSRYLAFEGMTKATLDNVIKTDKTGQTVKRTLERFAWYLTTVGGVNGRSLAPSTVVGYFLRTKVVLLAIAPRVPKHVDASLNKMAAQLERYCNQRDGTVPNPAPACTKDQLHAMTTYLYSNATELVHYQEAALLTLLWHLLGRASDLAELCKKHLARDRNTFFLQLLRMKTNADHGLTIVPDDLYATCPITAIAVALATVECPGKRVLPHLPSQRTQAAPAAVAAASIAEWTPLIDLLRSNGDGAGGIDLDVDGHEDVAAGPKTTEMKSECKAPGIHAYVNRILMRIMGPAGITERLTSQSFCRGGAQHAHTHPELSVQWICDRGAWSMTSTSKAFGYILSTTKEDQMVAKVLSGHKPRDNVAVLDLNGLNSTTRSEIRRFRDVIYSESTGFDVPEKNASPAVFDTLVAYLIMHFPRIKAANAKGPLVTSVERALKDLEFPEPRLLDWARHITEVRNGLAAVEHVEPATKTTLNESDKQLIRSLLASNKALTTNVERLGQRVGNLTDQLAAGGDELAGRAPRPNAKRSAEKEIVGSKPVEKKAKATRAASMAMAKTWYTWFVGTPAMYTAEWDASNDNRQHKNQTKTVVAFMRLFATEGYVLRADAPHYKSLVAEIGERLEARCKAFLQEHNLSAASASPVAKAFRELRDSGALDDKAAMTARLLATGIIVDPSPPSMHATAMAKNVKKTQSQTKT